MPARKRVRIRRAPIAAWDAYPDQKERKRWNRFKLAFRRAHPHAKRGNTYHKRVHAAYEAQANSTLDQWLSPVDSNGGGDGSDSGA